MEDLEKILLEERENFIRSEVILRQFAINIRGLDPIPSEKEIEWHLQACRDYYEIYGSKDGDLSPWISARRKF